MENKLIRAEKCSLLICPALFGKTLHTKKPSNKMKRTGMQKTEKEIVSQKGTTMEIRGKSQSESRGKI